MPINSKKGKKGFNWEKTANAKIQHYKTNWASCLLVSMIKPPISSKD